MKRITYARNRPASKFRAQSLEGFASGCGARGARLACRPVPWHSRAVSELSSAAPRWRQLALPFAHRPEFGAADLLAAPSNADALAWLARTDTWPQRRLALWGEAGCGKTHLLNLWAARSGAALLFGPAVRPAPPPAGRPIAVDDADAADEHALLHLLNTAAEDGQPVLLAARAPPARWPVALPDLASRLRAVTAVGIGPAEDDLLRALLARLLAERQLAVPAAVQDWLLLRLPRTPAALRAAAARLDRAALATGRPVTRPLAAAVLGDLVAGEQEAIAAACTEPALLL
jgi:chromosomal replication initiation ATPase DnaA